MGSELVDDSNDSGHFPDPGQLVSIPSGQYCCRLNTCRMRCTVPGTQSVLEFEDREGPRADDLFLSQRHFML